MVGGCKYFYVTIVRHGETNENKKQIIQGQLDTLLSPEGLEQAKRLGEKLRGLYIDEIISSNLRRAYDTAAGIKDNYSRTTLPLTTNKLMRERDFGIKNGQPRSLIHKFIHQSKETPNGCEFWHADNAECVHQVTWRAINFFFDLCQLVNDRPPQPPPAFMHINSPECPALPIFLPIKTAPVPVAFSQPSVCSVTNLQSQNPFDITAGNGADHRSMPYAGHIVLPREGNLGFPQAKDMIPVLSNCQFCQFGIAFRPAEMQSYAHRLRTEVFAATSSKISTKGPHQCPYNLNLPKMPFYAVCYHTRLGAEDVNGGLVEKGMSPPPSEMPKVVRVDGAQDTAKASPAAASSGVETLFFMSEDDEYAGLPTLAP
nr:unnamed protein product [Spirometra erinaceieuropaei]